MGLFFRQRAEGLLSRKNDFIAAVSLPQMKGIERFRAVSRTVIGQIRENRRRLKWGFYRKRRADRFEYVSLVAKQLQCAETRALWHVNVSLSTEEEQRLADLSADLSKADWTYYQSLAKVSVYAMLRVCRDVFDLLPDAAPANPCPYVSGI